MEEEKKREVATFRFGVISDLVVSHTLERGERERLLREKAERQWVPRSRSNFGDNGAGKGFDYCLKTGRKKRNSRDNPETVIM